jgi:lipoprotein-releasing system permease protein
MIFSWFSSSSYKFPWFLASRYFTNKRKGSRFLSFIQTMAIAGVAVGAGGLLIALSIAHGFSSAIYEKIYAFSPNIEIRTYLPDQFERADSLRSFILTFDGVTSAEPTITGRVMVQTSRLAEGVILKGVEQNDTAPPRFPPEMIRSGHYTFERTESGLPGIVIGSGVATSLDAQTGQRLTLFSFPRGDGKRQTPEIAQFTVTGIVHTGIERFDDEFVFADLRQVRQLLGFGPRSATNLEIRVDDRDRLMEIFQEIRDRTSYPYITETVYMRNQNMFAWVELQEATVPLIIGVMILIAAFNLIGTILMMVLERVRDIGILKAMGSPNRTIERIFLLEGFFIAASGLLLGCVLSLVFYWLQTEYALIPLPEENYYMSTAPVEPHLTDFVLVSFVTATLCLLASWLPARYAAKIQPVRAIARI